ncbi:uncharacterized protein LOC133307883 isoform X5 [Gastrolobium bilobum]|uniref:uncharacterized protein LOC133307883 isoform X5 n=1 Tax=Gastrolobium bilobum TaxID=150636 RepID=UPI002AB316C3|nr:uncharacterized protein LOC133307883 isoform X5 [Gastrolobium bilobum]
MGRSLFDALVSVFVTVHPHETSALLHSFFCFFFILSAYFVVLPLRDEGAISLGLSNLPGLFVGSLVLTLFAAPLSSLIFSLPNLSKNKALVLIHRFFSVSLVVFFILWHSSSAGYSTSNQIGSSTLTVPSKEGGKIDEQGSLASSFGWNNHGWFYISVRIGLFLWVALLNLITISSTWARVIDVMDSEVQDYSGLLVRVPPSDNCLGHCLPQEWLLLAHKVSVVATTVTSSLGRRKLFAQINSFIAVFILVGQLSLTGRILTVAGVTTAISSAPLVGLLNFVVLAVWPDWVVVAICETLRKVVTYVVSRPGRELLFTVVSEDEKYKAKICIDVLVQRFGDAAAAGMYKMLFGTLNGKPSTVSLYGLPVCLLWIVTAFSLGRRQAQLSKHQISSS